MRDFEKRLLELGYHKTKKTKLDQLVEWTRPKPKHPKCATPGRPFCRGNLVITLHTTVLDMSLNCRVCQYRRYATFKQAKKFLGEE